MQADINAEPQHKHTECIRRAGEDLNLALTYLEKFQSGMTFL